MIIIHTPATCPDNANPLSTYILGKELITMGVALISEVQKLLEETEKAKQ